MSNNWRTVSLDLVLISRSEIKKQCWNTQFQAHTEQARAQTRGYKELVYPARMNVMASTDSNNIDPNCPWRSLLVITLMY